MKMKIKFNINPVDYFLACVLILTIVAATSCNSLKKQQRKAEAFYNYNPIELAKKAVVMFPDRLEEKVIGNADTLSDRIHVDTVTKEVTRLIVKLRVDTIYKTNGKTLAILNDKITQSEAKIEAGNIAGLELVKVLNKTELAKRDAKESARIWKLRFFGLVIAFGVIVLVRLYIKKI